MGDAVYLSGFMAAGKTTVGRQLAELLGYSFVDLDALIEARCERTIAEIFAAEGEETFRQLERETLLDLSGRDNTVVALGGGTLTREENRRLARRCGQVVWLNTPRSTILARLEGGGASRPLFEDRERAIELLDSRVASYRDCDLEIRPEPGESPRAIAERIRHRLA